MSEITPKEIANDLHSPSTVELGELEVQVKTTIGGKVARESQTVKKALSGETPDLSECIDETVELLTHLTEDRLTREFWREYYSEYGELGLRKAAVAILNKRYKNEGVS